MESQLVFVAQGKQKDYPGKNTIMDALDDNQEVELTFFCDDKKIIIINHIGEINSTIFLKGECIGIKYWEYNF